MSSSHRSQRFLPAYRQLIGEADRWFAEALAVHRSDGVHCDRGCSLCCLGLFDVSAADSLLIAEGYRHADQARRKELRDSARACLDALGRIAPDWQDPWSVDALGEDRFDEICEAVSSAPCAALAQDGSCRIYDHRPLICRLHGLPMYDPAESRDCGGACELNFSPEDLDAKPALHFDHSDFVRRETELIDAIEAQTDRASRGTTIVAAVIWRAAVEEETKHER
ncbi:MAG: YkgJ family cysteine cluster protein [Acidobacteriota bacterium]